MENSIKEVTPSITSREFCSPQRLEQEPDNKYFQDFCKSVVDLKDFPAANDLIRDERSGVVEKPSISQKLADIEKALSRTTLKLSNPDADALEKTFVELNASQREQVQKAYEEKNKKPLLKEIAAKFDPMSADYHNLKGLLLRSDSENSMIAVQLHNAIKKVAKTSSDIEKTDEGASAGYLRTGGKGGGLIATIDLISSLAGRGSRYFQNKSLGEVVSKMTAQDVAEMKSEHMRIYRRDIGDMVENTPGLSKAARQAFKEKGIE